MTLQSVQGHECNSPRLFAVHGLQQSGGRIVVIDDDVEETLRSAPIVVLSLPVPGSGLYCHLVSVGDVEELVQRSVHAIQIELLRETLDGSQATRSVLTISEYSRGNCV